MALLIAPGDHRMLTNLVGLAVRRVALLTEICRLLQYRVPDAPRSFWCAR